MFQKSQMTPFESFSLCGELPVHGSLALRAWLHPEKRVFTFLDDRGEESNALSYLELWQQARAVADVLSSRYPAGERVMLFFPQGLEFIAAFLGCLMSGHVGVPITLPSRNRIDRCIKIIRNSGAKCVLSTLKVADTSRPIFADTPAAGLEWICIEDVRRVPRRPETENCGRNEDQRRVAFLQYTSGSTSDPRGVMVTHNNLTINLRLIRDAWELSSETDMVFWQPHHHDMGLIMGQLLPIALGNHTVLMNPNTVVRQPLLWLRAICNYRATMAGGPNFIFDVAVERYAEDKFSELDLSCWEVAPNGADIVRAGTLDRFAKTYGRHGFRPEAFLPAYGLAEGTLVVSGGPTRRTPSRLILDSEELSKNRRVCPPKAPQHANELVGCGEPCIPYEVAIVDPDTCKRCGPNESGEIWISGPSVAAGYWQNNAATEATFRAKIVGEGETAYLRTGDLGFVHSGDGQLYICGRLKDVIISDGCNFHPEDIEYSIIESVSVLKHQSCAVFGYYDEAKRQRIASAIEVDRAFKRRAPEDFKQIKTQVRQAVADKHGIALSDIVFIPPNSLRKTTSGKIQRSMMRQLFVSGQLETLKS